MTAPFETFERSIELPVSAKEAFDWHAREGAFERLSPPFQPVELVERQGGIETGDRTVLRMGHKPLTVRWVAEHRDTVDGRRFRDVQVEGPFDHWVHTHEFEDTGTGSIATDSIEWAPPAGRLGRALAAAPIERSLERMFRYRQDTLVADLEEHARYADRPRLAVAVSGASGLIGSALRGLLSTGGHRVLNLVRRPASNEHEVHWDPERGVIDLERLEGIDAVVHLAGENIASGRWTEDRRQRIRRSRTEATVELVRSLERLAQPPKAFLCASAVGLYGSEAGPGLTEDSPAGDDFLARVSVDWEESASQAARFGARVVNLRFGVVLSPAGGALGKMLPAFLAGAGGPLGKGHQLQSWVSVDDAAYAILFLLMSEDASGPFNVCSPENPTQAEFARCLGQVLRRPAMLPLPRFALHLLFGEMADQTLLASIGARPERLSAAGFELRYPHLEGALRHLLGRHRP